MTGSLVTSTPKSSMHALAFQGIMAWTCHAQIADMLRNRLGDEYVLLFASPAENRASGDIDWYSPVQGPARKLNDLPQEEQLPIREKLARMAGEILRLAEELIHSPDSLKVTRGNILKLALKYPDDNALYVVGRQPVYTCWGFGPGTPGVEPQELFRIAPASASKAHAAPGKPAITAAPENSAPAKTNTAGWLWWFLPLLGAFLLFLFLFTGFGPLGALSGCPLLQAGWPGEGKNHAGLEEMTAEIKRLRAQVDEHASQCRPKAGVASGPEPQTPALVIPENARSAEFMRGSWLCQTGLADAKTGEPVQVAFEFDENGKGKGTVYRKNDVCQGPANAKLENGALLINLDEQICRAGGGYGKVLIECRNAGAGATQCFGLNENGNKWEATFHKIR